MSWDTPFSEPIPVPSGKPLRTLREAGEMIQSLPDIEVQKEHWQTALHVLLQAADHGGPVFFARIGIMQALDRGERIYDSSRKDPVWRNSRKLARDA